MADMHHEIQIAASPDKIYDAIATVEGLRGWWTGDSIAEPRVGSTAKFGFYDRRFLFRMRIEELIPGKKVSGPVLEITTSGRVRGLPGRSYRGTEQ